MRFTAIFGLVCAIASPASGAALNEVLAKMDQNAGKFSGMSAVLKKTSYTKVIDDTGEETGSILLKKTKPKDLQVLIDFTKPDPKSVAFKGNKGEIYFPKMKTVQEYDLGKHSDLVDQFLLLGFGTTGTELRANYTVTLGGEEAIAGQKGYKLQLVPKAAARREKLSQLELWVSEDGAHPLQQKFVEPSGNYTVFTFSEVKLSAAIRDEQMRLKLPKGVKREFPQK